jgi:hypothetical protein
MSPTRLWTVNRPSVIFDEQAGESVVIDLTNGHYFRLDAASTALWLRLAASATVDDLLSSVENPDDLRAALPDILTDLEARGLVREAAPHEVAVQPGPWRFDGFTLEEFTDLEDVLGLDPIHEADPQQGWPHATAS